MLKCQNIIFMTILIPLYSFVGADDSPKTAWQFKLQSMQLIHSV
jgi:hypothetical protein